MTIDLATKELTDNIKSAFRLWKNDITITEAEGNLYDIVIPCSVPFILKYNSHSEPSIECGNNTVELDRNDFHMISIF